MRLQHTHDTDGPVKVTISTPGLPVFITVDEDAQHCSVDVVSDAGAIWAGPTGFRGSGFGVETGSSLVNSLRGGSYVSGGGTVQAGGRGSIVSGGSHGGSVRATGRGSVAAMGNIENVVTGDGARIIGSKPAFTPEPGVYLTVPEGCTFSFRRFLNLTVRKGDHVARNVQDAEDHGWLEVKR